MPAPGLGEDAGFAAGMVGMEATGGWMMADLKANDPGFKWSIAPLPRGTQRKTVIFVDPLMITSWF